MRIKFLSFIASFFMVSFVITSCLDDDNNIEYSPDATIHAFSLDTIGYGITYKFTIDQQKGEIYNVDSLPVHADTIIDKILIKTLTTASGIVTMKDKNDQDSTININDSIDLREPLKIKVWSTEAFATNPPDITKTKDYTISVRVHKHDPDSLKWKYVGKADNNITKAQRSIIFNSNIFTYTIIGNELKVYQNPIDNPNNWTPSSVTGIDASIKSIPTSIIIFKNKIYATFRNESGTTYAYTSENGITWEESALINVEFFTASIKEKFDIKKDKAISYIRKVSDEKYIFATSTDGITEDYSLYDTYKASLNKKEIKKFPNIITSYTNYENHNGTIGAMLIGEAKESTTISDGKNNDIKIAVAWGYSEESPEVNKLDDNGNTVKDENGDPVKIRITISKWGDLPAGSINTYCPELINPTIIFYNSRFYLFGDEFDSFYTSQSGRDWEKTEKKFSFPYQDWTKENTGYDPIDFPEFRGRENYSMVVDEEKQYLVFIFGKGTASFDEKVEDKEDTTRATERRSYSYNSEVWRARLNQLWFDLDPEHAGQ